VLADAAANPTDRRDLDRENFFEMRLAVLAAPQAKRITGPKLCFERDHTK